VPLIVIQTSYLPARTRQGAQNQSEIAMFNVSHILVLSQPDFVQKQVCSQFAKEEPEVPAHSPSAGLPRPAGPDASLRKLKPRGRLRW
jgi:hypothetical protein